jgi:Family of unknown function (DUF6223)
MIRWALRRAIHKFELFLRVTGLFVVAVLVGAFGLAASAVAQVSDQPAAASVYTLSGGRIGAIVGGVLGLIGAVVGGRALSRSAGRNNTDNMRRGATVALVLGPIGLVIGGLVVATADGGVGTGNGLGGAVVAMVVGLIGTALGGLALARARHSG